MNKRSLTTRYVRTLLAVLLLIALAACERRPLEVYYEPMAIVRVKLDWMDQYRERPNGMMMLIYDETDSLIQSKLTNDIDEQVLYLPAGNYKMVFSSNPENATIYFQRLGNCFYATARAEDYKGHNYEYWETGKYSEAPEHIGVAVDTITITPDMVTTEVNFVEYTHRNEAVADTTQFVFYEVPDPMTVTVYIKAKIKRRQSVKSIYASLSGMADGFVLSQVKRTAGTSSTLYLPDEDWHRERYGEEKDSMGIIYTQISSFGLPFGKEVIEERDSTDNVLTFHITLVNDSVQDCSFNVGKEIRCLNLKGDEARIRNRLDLRDLKIELDLSEVIVMPPTPATRVGQGFDAVVDEWEDGGTFDIGGF